jgi:tRNA pseudouridine38-40 synthase
MRIALGIEYDGSHFSGWQTQEAGVRTVQSCVESALSKVANHPVSVICAGRTDRGVHAFAQVIHADVEVERPMRAWILGATVNLPKDINVLWAQPVDNEFHARFSAKARHYRYIILNRPTRSAIYAKRVSWFCRPLDVEKMREASQYLIGTHDFSSYRAINCQAKSPVKTVHYINITQYEQQIRIDIGANAFLHHMVRNIAGVLMGIGVGDQPPAWAKIVLEARDRTAGGVTAQPDGLYFCKVDYPEQYQFPVVPIY